LFKIQVYDLHTAVRKAISPHTKTENPTRIVSLLDDVNAVPKVGDHHLIVAVSDVSVESSNYPALLLGTSEPIVPVREHLLAVLEHTKDLTDEDYVLVHCFAGQSRSTAMAIAICIQNGMHWKDAFDHIYSVRPVMMPNAKMIQLIDEHFELNGEFVAFYRNWLMGALNQRIVDATKGFTDEEKANASAQMNRFKDILAGNIPEKQEVLIKGNSIQAKIARAQKRLEKLIEKYDEYLNKAADYQEKAEEISEKISELENELEELEDSLEAE
jgi:predicted protein tyrosine phosphatase